MNNFLHLVNTALANIEKYENVYVVMGNESCDLDSAVSALTFAYYLNSQPNQLQSNIVVPILNIEKNEFPLRTETRYFLHKLCIDTDKLVFRNSLNIKQLCDEKKLKLVLVDHHVLPIHDSDLEEFVCEIIDHRPKDKKANWENVSCTINTVGSCTTLIADIILKKNQNILDEIIAKLLHGTIIVDTINFNAKANRFAQLDVDIANKLEKLYKIPYSREDIYKEIVTARSDVSHLTPFQILHKDMKIINAVPFPGVPMLVSEFLKLSGAPESLKQFCESKKCNVMVPMGLKTENNEVFRDIGVFSIQDCDLKSNLVQFLKSDNDLKLSEMKTDVEGLVLFSQANVKATRKHIVPLLGPIIINNE